MSLFLVKYFHGPHISCAVWKFSTTNEGNYGLVFTQNQGKHRPLARRNLKLPHIENYICGKTKKCLLFTQMQRKFYLSRATFHMKTLHGFQ